MKYVACENLFIAWAVQHREALEAGEKGKLYLDDIKVKPYKDGAVIYADDSYTFLQTKLKDKEKATEEEAMLDKVEKVKTKKEKDKEPK